MRLVRILLVVLLVFCAVFFGALVCSRMYGKHFLVIPPGTPKSAVTMLVGRPSREMACMSLPEPPRGCSTVLVYAGPLSTLMPEFWLMPLDNRDRVIRVQHATRAE